MDAKNAAWFNTVELDDFQNQVDVLFDLGHFIGSSFPDFSDECRKTVLKECRRGSTSLFLMATRSLQEHSGLKTDSQFGPKTVASVKARFCPLADIQPAGSNSKWSFNDLTVWHDMQSLSAHDEVAAAMTALNMWAKYTPLTFKFWQSNSDPKPNFYAHARRIDGPGGVLAWHQLPPNNAGRNVQLEGRFDTGEAWRELWFLIATLCHEYGHGLGLRHSRTTSDIMYHTMNGTREPAAGDIAAIRALYGKGTGGTPGPDPDPDKIVEIVSRQLLGRTEDGRDLFVQHTLEKL